MIEFQKQLRLVTVVMATDNVSKYSIDSYLIITFHLYQMFSGIGVVYLSFTQCAIL